MELSDRSKYFRRHILQPSGGWLYDYVLLLAPASGAWDLLLLSVLFFASWILLRLASPEVALIIGRIFDLTIPLQIQMSSSKAVRDLHATHLTSYWPILLLATLAEASCYVLVHSRLFTLVVCLKTTSLVLVWMWRRGDGSFITPFLSQHLPEAVSELHLPINPFSNTENSWDRRLSRIYDDPARRAQIIAYAKTQTDPEAVIQDAINRKPESGCRPEQGAHRGETKRPPKERAKTGETERSTAERQNENSDQARRLQDLFPDSKELAKIRAKAAERGPKAGKYLDKVIAQKEAALGKKQKAKEDRAKKRALKSRDSSGEEGLDEDRKWHQMLEDAGVTDRKKREQHIGMVRSKGGDVEDIKKIIKKLKSREAKATKGEGSSEIPHEKKLKADLTREQLKAYDERLQGLGEKQEKERRRILKKVRQAKDPEGVFNRYAERYKSKSATPASKISPVQTDFTDAELEGNLLSRSQLERKKRSAEKAKQKARNQEERTAVDPSDFEGNLADSRGRKWQQQPAPGEEGDSGDSSDYDGNLQRRIGRDHSQA